MKETADAPPPGSIEGGSNAAEEKVTPQEADVTSTSLLDRTPSDESSLISSTTTSEEMQGGDTDTSLSVVPGSVLNHAEDAFTSSRRPPQLAESPELFETRPEDAHPVPEEPGSQQHSDQKTHADKTAALSVGKEANVTAENSVSTVSSDSKPDSKDKFASMPMHSHMAVGSMKAIAVLDKGDEAKVQTLEDDQTEEETSLNTSSDLSSSSSESESEPVSCPIWLWIRCATYGTDVAFADN